MKAIVVGAGGITRELLRHLGDFWDISVIDTDEERLALAATVRDIETVAGDGSSRVILERAGLAGADALVAATNDDDVNLEACRIAREVGLVRIVAVAAAPERLPGYKEADIPVMPPHRLVARRLELSLEPRRVSSTAFAHGRAEAIEFLIAEDSPVRGIVLRDLHAESWLVAAILRDHELIVPHGNTTLRTGDRVTVVGAAADFPLIIRTFTAAAARFPLDFGKRVAVILDSRADLEGPVGEAINLTRNTQASSLLLVHRRIDGISDETHAREIGVMLDEAEERAGGVEIRRRPVSGPPMRALLSVIKDESVGVVVLPAPSRGWLGRAKTVRALRNAVDLRLPVLFSRSTHPYQQLVAPARDTTLGSTASRAAIDVAAHGKGEVTGVAVTPPVFLAGADGREAALRALTRLREEAAVQGVTVHRTMRQGNPVKAILEVADGANLLVVGLAARSPSLLRPGFVGHLLLRASISVLAVPAGA